MFKRFGTAALLMLLASCGAPRLHHAPPARPVPAAPEIQSAAGMYRIDAGQSELRVLVYRAGPMARLGHNHVMVNRALSGSAHLAEPATASTFSLTVPAGGFVVDDAQARSEEGADFPGEIPEDAKAGTLRNMLGAALLDAADYPAITVRCVSLAEGSGGLLATLTINIAGHDANLVAPFTLQSDPQRLSATGSFDLRQSDLGLTPFSLMLGALQVQDTVRLKFKIIAVAG